MQIVRAIFFSALLCFSRTGGFSSVPQPKEEEVDDLVRWVLATGKPTVLRKNVASIMGVAVEDIMVAERGFRTIGDKTTHVIGARPGNGSAGIEFFFFARIVEEDGSGTIWRSTPSGKLQTSIRLDPEEGVQLLSNEAQLGEFLSEKEYFRRKMREVRSK